MELSLEDLEYHKKKYVAELDAALAQYTELQRQAKNMDAMKLDAARQAIQLDRERETFQRLQATYGKRFDSGILAQSRKDVAVLLGEVVEPVSIRQKFQEQVQCREKQQNRKYLDQER